MAVDVKTYADFLQIEQAIVDFLDAGHVETCSEYGEWQCLDRDGGNGPLFSISALALAIAERLNGKH